MTGSSETFRLERVNRMDRVTADIYREVDDAQAQTIGGDEFALALEPTIQGAFYAEYQALGEFAIRNPADAWKWAWPKIKPGLVAASDLADPRKIATWLGTAIVNAAQVATGTRPKKMWLSRRDDKVRPFHVEADGQTVDWDGQFTVCDGRKMDFPGQPVGDPDCWINCRCVVAVGMGQTMTAATVNDSNNVTVEQADDPGGVGMCIVAIPMADDPIWSASSEQVPHMTVIWLGKDNVAPEEMQAIKDAIARVAGAFDPVEASIKSREPLGDDNADVAMLDPGQMGDIHDELLADEAIKGPFDRVEQYPQWTPHVTLGYPESPAKGDPGETIRFDRLALWDQEYAGEEFPMTTTTEDPQVEDAPDLSEMVGDDEPIDVPPVPWHGVLAPEGIASGDGRRFTEGAITWRDLPLPLLWQESSGMGHEGAVIVGQISDIWRDANLIHATGTFAQNEAAEKVIGLLAEGHLRGVSVDIDSAEMAVDGEDEDPNQEMLFSKGRISAATLCAIPAFHEAFVSLGAGERSLVEEPIAAAAPPSHPVRGPYVDEPLPFGPLDMDGNTFISEAPWDGSAGRFTPEQWKASCCLHMADEVEPKSNHKLPIKEPEGALSRAGTHAAASRFNQVEAPPEKKAAAKSTLRGAYKTLGEEPPEVIAASAVDVALGLITATNTVLGLSGQTTTSNTANVSVTYARGPGWVTDPIATKRIHDYWTRPGEEGYAKIGWGTDGDFRRLRAYLSKYIGPEFLNRTTAQWHYDALGYWPGELGKPGNPVTRSHAGETVGTSVILASVPALTDYHLPSEWFVDPALTAATPVTVTDDGRVFGHLATWGVCHIGIPGTCVEAPKSAYSYGYFTTGVVQTSGGAIPCGQITMDTGHAPVSAGAKQAAAHYDNTGAVVADVAVGEDEYGIWIAGALRDNLPAKQVAALRAGALSGDWRLIRGSLELVAALVVNVPGFPIPRTGLAASGGVQTALVAAGVVAKEAGDSDDVAEFIQAVADEVESRAARRTRAAALLEDTKALRVAALMQKVEV